MKKIGGCLAMVAVTAVIGGTARAQDAFAWFNQGLQTNSAPGAAVSEKSDIPTFQLSPRLKLTGLLVDCCKPRQAWAMLKNPAPEPGRAVDAAAASAGTAVSRPFNDPVVDQEPSILMLRLHFP